MLVPDSGRLAAAALRGFRRGGPGARALDVVAAGLLAHGRPPPGMRVTITEPVGAVSLQTHLGGLLGQPVRVAVRRASSCDGRVVVQALGGRGETVAYAKVGVTPAGDALVRNEARALDLLGGVPLRSVATPGLVHHGQWRGLDLLVQTPLRTAGPRLRPDRALLLAAMGEVAGCSGERREPLVTSRYLERLQQRLARLDRDDGSAVLHQTLAALLHHPRAAPWSFGAWHGDWAPDTGRADGRRVQLLGWERFEPSVPYGFDVLHHALHLLLARRRGQARVAERLLADARSLLGGWRAPAGEERAIVTAYLVEIGARRLEAEQAGTAGRDTPRLRTWLLPAMAKEAHWLTAGQGPRSS